MFLINIINMMILMILLILFSMMILLSKKNNFYNYEKMSPFECGMDQINFSRMPFSLKFFIIIIIFLIFDLEIVLILPINKIFYTSNLLNWIITIMIFIMTLLISISYEWNKGMLMWMK